MDAKQTTNRLLILSGVVDLALGILKIGVGVFANSYALVVDGFHSLSDLATDAMVWFFNAIGSQEPDEDHPYGHASFETFGTFFLGILLIALSGYIVYESVDRLLHLDEYTIPTWPALVATIISILAKEWLFRVTLKTGKETRSKLLQANAWHHRTDTLSSIIVFVGILAALCAYAWIELVAAIAVAAMITSVGWSLAKQSVAELVDTALSENYVDEIKASVINVEGVKGVHNIRTRSMGSDALVDIHLQVDPAISVSEGHHIGEWVSKTLDKKFTEVNDVIVHIDAEDDEYLEERTADELSPLRKTVREQLFQCWSGMLEPDDIIKMNLHYLDNGIDVELFLKARDANQTAEQLKQAASHLAWLQKVSTWYQ